MSSMRYFTNRNFPDPQKTPFLRWWMRHGLIVAWGMFAVAVALMIASTVLEYLDTLSMPGPDLRLIHDEAGTARGWAIIVGIFALMCFCDVLVQRVIMRMTQIIALFTTDVPPRQPKAGKVDEGAPDASVTEIYRDPAIPPWYPDGEDEPPARAD